MFYLQIAAGSLQTLEAIGITSSSIKYLANGIDTLDFTVDSALTAAGIAYGTAIKLYDDATCIFIGEITDLPSDATASAPAQKYYTARSYLHRLTRSQYTQDISAFNPLAEETQDYIDPRVVLGLRYPASRITNTTQITDVLDFAISIKSVPVSRADTWPAGFLCPSDQKENISCWDAIVSQLRWIPDHILYCDYSTGSTVVKLAKAADITPSTITVTSNLASISATPRYDLQMCGLNVFFRRVSTFDGAAVENRYVQSAGSYMDALADNLYIDLDGGETSFVRQAITVSPYPESDWKVWLTTRAPWLADLDTFDITNVSRSGTKSYEQELVKGPILKWMPVSSEEETITFTVEYDITDSEGNYIERATTKIPVQVTSCNGTTKTYSKIASSDSGEAEPTGLAAGLYASWSMLHWDGSLSTYLIRTGYILPGSRLNISGAHASLASMGAIVQATTIDLQTCSVDITYGTCRALEADSFTALYRAIRYRRSSTRILADEDDDEAIEEDETSILSTPRGSAHSSPAITRSQIGASGSSGRAVSLDASDLDASEVAKFRDCTFTDTDGEEQTVRILSTAAMSIGGDTSGIPAGCTQTTVTLYAKEFKLVAKLNHKTVGEVTTYYGLSDWSIVAYTSADTRLLLQGTEPTTGTYALDLAKGYLKE